MALDAGARKRAGGVVQHPHVYFTHGTLPGELRDGNLLFAPAVGFHNPELRQASLVRDVSDPLPIGRPARMEVVVVPEGHLVRLSTGHRQNVKMVELVGCAARRGVEETLAVKGGRGPRSVEALLAQYRRRFRDAARSRWHAPDVTGA